MGDVIPVAALVAPLALALGAVWRLSGQVHEATNTAARLTRETADLRAALARVENERVSLATCEERMRAQAQRQRLEVALAVRGGGGGTPDSGPSS